MKVSASSIEHLVLLAADGTAVLVPATAPIASLLHRLAVVLEETGVIPAEVPAASVEQLNAVAAGMAAARASAVTAAMGHSDPLNPLYPPGSLAAEIVATHPDREHQLGIAAKVALLEARLAAATKGTP